MRHPTGSGPVRRLAAFAALLALLVTACGNGEEIRLEAVFDDVIDLSPRHHVRAGDVPVGTVRSIELTDDDRALVVMHVQPDSGLPSEVEAVLRKTALLGERYVELRPLSTGGELASGTVDQTRTISDIEDLVATGGELVTAVSADQLARAVQIGALTFGGRGSAIGGLIERLEVFVGRYDEGKHDILRLIDASDQLLTGMAAESESNAEAIAHLARASAALSEEDDRLLDALDDLSRLAIVGERILASHRGEMDGFIRRLRQVVEEILRIDNALQNVLTWFPRHNLHVPNGVLNDMSQVWNDFSVCGMDDEPDNPSNSCTPPNPGYMADPPPRFAGPDECDFYHENCPYEEGVDTYQPYHDEQGRRP